MKKVLFALVAVVALGLSTTAKADIVTVSYDVSGITSYGALGDPNNVLASVNLGAYTDITVTGIGWDVTVEAFSPSWLSEIRVAFLDSAIGLNLSPVTGNNSGVGSGSSPILDLASIDPTFPFSLSSNILSLEFFEGFDDASIAPDGQWLSGTLTFQFSGTAVPEPSALSLLALAGVGMVARRRRS